MMAEQRLGLLFADAPGLGRRAADDLQATYERVCLTFEPIPGAGPPYCAYFAIAARTSAGSSI
jgi:hypothetical protein